jgi:hypothetical protein
MMITIKLVFKNHDHYHKNVLTVDKVYDATYDETEPVYSSTGLYYIITDDVGQKREIHEFHFITLDKWRQIQLDKVIENN